MGIKVANTLLLLTLTPEPSPTHEAAILNNWYDISGMMLNKCNTATLVSFTHFPQWYLPPH